jgi:predicted dinucleotide-binding enzyme
VGASTDDDLFALEDWVAGLSVVVVTAPWSALEGRLWELRRMLERRVVVSAATEVSFDADGYVVLPGPSVAERLAEALPGSAVVGAFQLLGGRHIRAALGGDWHSDVPLTGDDPAAVALVAELVETIPGLVAVPAGSLRQTAAIEGFVAVLRQVEDDRVRPLGVRLGQNGLSIIN